MWFPTNEKVARKLDELLATFASLDQRIGYYEANFKLVADPRGSAEIAQMRVAHTEISSGIVEALRRVTDGQSQPMDFSGMIKPLSDAARKMTKILDKADSEQVAAKAWVRQRIGG